MSIGAAVILACLLAYAIKLTGFSVPEHLLDGPVISRALNLLPVALLAGLVSLQTFTGTEHPVVVDARLAGVAVAVVALLLRAPFLVVICLAAASAAGLRALGWLA